MDFISDKLADYLNKNSEKEPEILSRLSKETHQKILQPRMLSGHIQGRFLSFISKIKSPDKILTPSLAITILSLSNISIDVASNFNSSE